MSELNKYNHLKNEASSYLKTHNQNPVNWYPYGPEAIQIAKDKNLPIFLSIGYNSCHWCHVMAKESFENQETADLLNKNFICIKVDKEELPDLDNYFQLACQVMNGRGGWPLNAFLTPDLKPYFVGTYFPAFSQDEVPSFREIIQNLANAYKTESSSIQENAQKIIEAITQAPTVENKINFEGHYPAPNAILNALKDYQDDDNGGYGAEPKFPHFSYLEFAIEQMLEGMISQEFGKHIIKTIESMMAGGLSDHARGGIHRYCVDKDWKIPHFEKMLYDQAGLLKLLAKTSLLYPSPLIYDSLIQTIDYIGNEMMSENGFFFSGQDADSEGVEGLYYGFTKDEFIDAIIDFDESLSDQMDNIQKWFDIKEKGNFDNQLNTIHLNLTYKDEFYSPEGWEIIRKVRQALAQARKLRIPPATDNKGVASWNFQVLSALLDVAHYCKIDSIKNAALELYSKTAAPIHQRFLYEDEEGKTRIRTSTTREFHVPLFEDYVFFAELSLKAYEIFGEKNFLINGQNTMDFIFNEFIKDNFVYTRAIAYSDSELYQNLHTPIFDQSYKSPLGTYMTLLRKWSINIPDFKDCLEALNQTTDALTHLSLQNPLAFGETLRALIYPNEAYRKIEVPLTWLKNRSFHPFFGNFSHRFALSYHDRDDNTWQICNHNECELQGNTVEEFAKVFQAPKE